MASTTGRPVSRPSSFESRYELAQKLGQGGAGAVFLAKDRDTGEHVALKKLLRLDAKSVLRLKREFRSLADLHHPNLVQLYELGQLDGTWFLTMEYLEGKGLLEHLDSGRSTTSRANRERPEASLFVVERIVSAFGQLARGVQALHAANKLHRDLKPSNVLVTRDRVVILDFGLVRELAEDELLLTADGFVSGTPAYMAPEQALGTVLLTEAADWYAFGVMLYETLTGRLPIEGRNANELLLRKVREEPLPLRKRDGAWTKLESLCMPLLARDPKARPSGDEIVAALDNAQSALAAAAEVANAPVDITQTQTQSAAVGATTPLFGREGALRELTDALHMAHAGRAVTVHVSGPSGTGKSSLVEHFLSSITIGANTNTNTDDGLLVLRSRCYERESMPFKTLDGLIESLVRRLERWNDIQVSHIFPSGVGELVKLFPMFERLNAVRALIRKNPSTITAFEARTRGENALGELLVRLGTTQRVVLWIDDLQWGDLDSVSILRRWQTQLSDAPVLLILCYRSEEIATSDCLSALLAAQAVTDASVARALERHITIDKLASDDVRLLCEDRLGILADEHPEVIDRIAYESQGNPFLVTQLATLAQSKIIRGDKDLDALSIEQLVVKTSALLPTSAREILNILAIAGRPLSPKLVLRVAGIDKDGRSLLHALHSLRLLRTRHSGAEQLIEVYHDRVREGIHSALGASDRQRICQILLVTLEQSNFGDVDWLHSLALGAGRRATALRHGLSAAARATDMLAFERAAALYRACLELTELEANSSELWRKYADALTLCGQAAQAAEAYLEVAKRVPPQDVVPMLQRAASHLSRSGEFERGEALAREVFQTLDIHLPTTDVGLLAAIGLERTRLALRGLDFVPRHERDVPAALLQKVDWLLPLSIENQAHQPLRAALFQARALRLCLEAGEPRRVARGLCASAIMACVSGSKRAARRSADMITRAEHIAKTVHEETLRAELLTARAMCAFLLGHLSEVIAPAEQAEVIYQRNLPVDAYGDYYHRFSLMAARIGTRYALGDFRLATSELDQVLLDARTAGNRSAALHLTLCHTIIDESRNEVYKSRTRLNEERSLLPKKSFGPLHVLHLVSVMRVACWLDDFNWADDVLEQGWPRWLRSPIRVSAFLSLLMFAVHSRYLLNRHVVRQQPGANPAGLRGDLRALGGLAQEHQRRGTQARVLSRVAYLEGDHARSATLLREVIASTEQEGAIAESARSRWALGLVLGGDEGAQLCDEGRRALLAYGVTHPRDDVRAYYPELISR